MNLKETRKKHNLTQSQVADFIKTSQQTYSDYENEKTQPNIETLIKLADYYHISLDELVGRPTTIINKMLLTDKEKSIIEKVLAMDLKQQELTEFYIDTLMKSI